jgi:hypothetical protein
MSVAVVSTGLAVGTVTGLPADRARTKVGGGVGDFVIFGTVR